MKESALCLPDLFAPLKSVSVTVDNNAIAIIIKKKTIFFIDIILKLKLAPRKISVVESITVENTNS